MSPFPEADERELVKLSPETMMGATARLEIKDVSLCEALDRVLNKGAVLFGEVMISVADIDLVYLGLQVILSSMETARDLKPAPGTARRDRIFLIREFTDETAATGAVESPALSDFSKIMQGDGLFPDSGSGPAPASTWTRTISRTAWDNWS